MYTCYSVIEKSAFVEQSQVEQSYLLNWMKHFISNTLHRYGFSLFNLHLKRQDPPHHPSKVALACVYPFFRFAVHFSCVMRLLCVQSNKRTRTPGALPDDQCDIILKHLGGKKIKRENSKGATKTALNKCNLWKYLLQDRKEAAYGGQTQPRIVFKDDSGKQLIVLKESEFGFVVNHFHKEYGGVGAEKVTYKWGRCTYMYH